MRLKATKSSLYKLVREYLPLPVMKRVCFSKVPRRRSYFLMWGPNDVLFNVRFGKPYLGIKQDGEWRCQYLGIQDLIERGMIEP